MTWNVCGRTAALAAGVVALTLSARPSAAQDPARGADPTPPPAKGAAARIGETVDRAGKSIKRGVSSTAESLREQYAHARASVHAMGVQSRVYSRLHWDKSLNGSEITPEVGRDGVTTLRGFVPDLKARARAVDLARETVGVTSVVDDGLVVRPASPGPADPAPAPATRP